MVLVEDLAMAGAEGTVVAATKTATTIHHRPTLNRHRIRSKTRARRPAPQPGGLDCSPAPPQAQLLDTLWGVATTTTTTADPAQGKPAHQTGLATATAEQALRARPLGEVEGRRLLHRLAAAGQDMNLRALAGVAGGRWEMECKGIGKGSIHIRHIDRTTWVEKRYETRVKRHEQLPCLLGFRTSSKRNLSIGNVPGIAD